MQFITRSALSCALVLAGASAAQAAVESISVQLDHADYDAARGSRDVAGVAVAGRTGESRWVLETAHGQRDFGDIAHSGTRAGASLHHRWNERLSTRTVARFSDDTPVFANREVGHDFKLKVLPNTVLHVGGRYAEYFGGTHVSGWSAGAAYYFPRVTAHYRHSRHHLSTRGEGHGDTLSLRLKDAQGRGSSQLWLGSGTSAYAPDMDPVLLRDNRSTSAFLRRNQPIGAHLTLNAGIGKTWHETPFEKYTSLSSQLGLAYHW